MEIATIAGNSITIGAAASSIVYILKRTKWFPLWANQPVRSRVTVAVVCVAINAAAQYIAGEPIADVAMLMQAFVSYVSAAATYDHLFKS